MTLCIAIEPLFERKISDDFISSKFMRFDFADSDPLIFEEELSHEFVASKLMIFRLF